MLLINSNNEYNIIYLYHYVQEISELGIIMQHTLSFLHYKPRQRIKPLSITITDKLNIDYT